MEVGTYDSLDGQTALVTGATRGIGAEIARQLAQLGATVYAGARTLADVDDDAVRPVLLDVTTEREVVNAADRIAEEAGRLDVLVNNAAVYGPHGPIHEADMAAIDRTLDTNLRGAIGVTTRVLPLLLDTAAPRVVNMSSGWGQLADGIGGGRGPYAVSKTAINGFTAYLHGEYGDAGLIANAANPGWVRTDMGGERAPRSVEKGAETPVWLARFRPGGPGGRLWKDREPIEW